MTEKLKNLMHQQAQSVDFAEPDVDTLTAAGDRVRRRRRTGWVAGGVATLAVAGTLVALTTGGDPERASEPDVATPPGPAATLEPGVSWVLGSTLNTPDGTVDLGHDALAYVRTSVGYVLVDPDGVVWSRVGDESTEVGHTGTKRPHLVSDDETGQAGWVDPSGDQAQFVVLDQADGTTSTYGEGTAEEFYALDDDTAYWKDDRGAVAVDLSSGDVRVLRADPGAAFVVSDAENGLVAVQDSRGGTRVLTPSGKEVELKKSYGGAGAFSPDGAYYSADADEPKVYDTASGEPVDLDLSYNFATGYDWLDDDTLVLIGQDGYQEDVELLTCRISTGACTTVAPLQRSFQGLDRDGFTIPVGAAVGD